MGRVPPYPRAARYPGTGLAASSHSSLAHHSQAHHPCWSSQPGEPQPEPGARGLALLATASLSCSSCPVLPLPCPALPCHARPCPVHTPLHWTGLGLASFGVGDWSPFQNRPCRRRFVLSSPNSTGASLDKASTCNLAALYRPSSPRRQPQTSLNSLESAPWSRRASLSAVATPPAARDEGVTRLGQSQLSHLEVRFPPQRSTPSSTPRAAHSPAKHNSPHPSTRPSTHHILNSLAQLTHIPLHHLPAHLPARLLPHSRSSCDLTLTLDLDCLLTMPAATGIQILARRQYVQSFAQLTINLCLFLSLPLPNTVFLVFPVSGDQLTRASAWHGRLSRNRRQVPEGMAR